MRIKIHITIGILLYASLTMAQSSMDLSGEWKFQMDMQDVGVAQQWYLHELSDVILLPGVLQAQGFGNAVDLETPWVFRENALIRMESYPNWFKHPMFEDYRQEGNFRFPYWLQPPAHYLGPAWYQKRVVIPETWSKGRVILSFERIRWQSDLWVNGQHVGTDLSLGTPHAYDLSQVLHVGENVITVRIDSSIALNLGVHAHSISDQTQITWNGAIGEIHLIHNPGPIIEWVDAFPDLDAGMLRLRVGLDFLGKDPRKYEIRVGGRSENAARNQRLLPQTFNVDDIRGVAEIKYDLPDEIMRWSEFEPNLYRFDVELHERGMPTAADKYSFRTGFRKIETRGGYFYINGIRAYMRGTLHCAEFPLNGYPDMDVDSWRNVFRAVREYGLNHVRFHSWCPPKAAFIAADELGVYLQPEVSEWVYISTPEQMDFLLEESARMLREYGNHPSFIFMALGNEAGVAPGYRDTFAEAWKGDNRRLYTLKANANNSFTDAYDFQIAYYETATNDRMRIQLGWVPQPDGSTIVVEAPNTLLEYSDVVTRYPHPIVTHETVQRNSYPRLSDVEKFTGILSPGYLYIARDQMKERGMYHLYEEFVYASGRWQVQQFKAEIEAHLRTEPLGGFQLLSIQDFPGQGTALVGVLDYFWENKGYTSAEEFRQFCSETVPLAVLTQRVFEGDSVLDFGVEVVYFGAKDLPEVKIRASLQDDSDTEIKSEELGTVALQRGVNRLGYVNWPLNEPERNQQLTIRIEVSGDVAGVNEWDIWHLQSSKVSESDIGNVKVVRHLTDDVIDGLLLGELVLLVPERSSIRGELPQCFSSMYWNCPWTDGGETHTMGIICQPDHPVFKSFPTTGNSDWHWWELLAECSPMILDEWEMEDAWPKAHRPLIQAIDGWLLNRKLGVLVEGAVGDGRIMVTSMDILSDLDQRPVARAMKKSILEYMNSTQFRPDRVSLEQVKALLK
jgi:hypothetical protein